MFGCVFENVMENISATTFPHFSSPKHIYNNIKKLDRKKKIVIGN